MSLHPLHDDIALTDGHWVNDRGIMRWVADEPMSDLADEHPDGEVVCRCGARAAQACRTKKGGRTSEHSFRTQPRTCRCGGPLERSQHWRTDCRIQRDRELGRSPRVGAA
tara:strand:+ start:11887 stop:12216 length:330 start_codon:yes stop_codon:yes gene_type:complete